MAQPLELHYQQNVLTINELWLRCAALGGAITPQQLVGFIRGEERPNRREYNLVAVALNEYLSDIGVTQFVPYIEDDTLTGAPGTLVASWTRSTCQ
jgi:hypothetical protein